MVKLELEPPRNPPPPVHGMTVMRPDRLMGGGATVVLKARSQRSNDVNTGRSAGQSPATRTSGQNKYAHVRLVLFTLIFPKPRESIRIRRKDRRLGRRSVECETDTGDAQKPGGRR